MVQCRRSKYNHSQNSHVANPFACSPRPESTHHGYTYCLGRLRPDTGGATVRNVRLHDGHPNPMPTPSPTPSQSLTLALTRFICTTLSLLAAPFVLWKLPVVGELIHQVRSNPNPSPSPSPSPNPNPNLSPNPHPNPNPKALALAETLPLTVNPSPNPNQVGGDSDAAAALTAAAAARRRVSAAQCVVQSF
jgi:hypothetical protein